jgi:iron complex outermembrane receptor protein
MRIRAYQIATICNLMLVASMVRAASREGDSDPTTRPASTAPTTQPLDRSDNSEDFTALSLEDLMNIKVTSVSKKKQSIADAPAAVSVISQEDIRRSGFSTIPDLLRLAPGMDVARINSHIWAISSRGLNDEFANKLLVMQDGRSLYTPFFGGVYWNTVDYVLEDLDRIEIIRGPGATLWGANAVNGVINIISKDSANTQGWLLSTRASNDDSNMSLRYGGRLSDDTTYRVYGKTTYNNELDDANGDNAGDDWSSLRGGFRIDKHPGVNDTFTLQGDVAGNKTIEPYPQVIPTPPFVQNTNFNRTDNSGNILTRWDHRSSASSDFSLQVYYDYVDAEYGPTNYYHNAFDIDFHQRVGLGERNEIIWGLGYRLYNSALKNTGIASADPTTRNDNLYTTFVQDTFTIEPEKWFFTLGSKFEFNNYTGYEMQPGARLLWTPNKQNSVWAAVSRAVHTPTRLASDARYIAAFTEIPTGPTTTAPGEITINGNKNFQSEELTAYELGYRFEPTKRVSIDIATFYNDYNHLQSIEAGGPQFGPTVVIPLTFANRIAGDTYGGEVETTVQVTDNWRLAGSYSLLETSFHSLRGSTDTTNAIAYENSAPKNQAQLRSYLDITKNLQFNALVFYVGKVGQQAGGAIPAYISTDLNFVWQPKESLQVQVGVLNLFDNHHPEFGTTAGIGSESETPRTFYTQLSYKF